jgi:predicted RNA-binding protein with PUA domain
MKKVKITKGKCAVIEQGGKLIAVKEAKTGLIIEAQDDVIVTEKNKSSLKVAEKAKLK